MDALMIVLRPLKKCQCSDGTPEEVSSFSAQAVHSCALARVIFWRQEDPIAHGLLVDCSPYMPLPVANADYAVPLQVRDDKGAICQCARREIPELKLHQASPDAGCCPYERSAETGLAAGPASQGFSGLTRRSTQGQQVPDRRFRPLRHVISSRNCTVIV